MAKLDKIGEDNNTVNPNDPYRGLLTAQDKVDQNLFYYDIITDPKTTIPGTAKIIGVNLEYVFKKEFGEDISQWETISSDTNTGSNKVYIDAMKPYVEKLIIPNEVTLDSNGKFSTSGQIYKITEIEELLYPSRDHSRNTIDGAWGTGAEADAYYLWDSPDLNVDVIIPEGVEYIRGFADDQKAINMHLIQRSIKQIEFPNSLLEIGAFAFEGFDGLEEIILPPTLQFIGLAAFSNGCDNVKKVTAPTGVYDGGDLIHCWPYYMEEFVINGGTTIGAEFYYCEYLSEITIPSYITTIGDYAFCGCSNLENISIPNSVTSIGYSAFYNCSKLTHVTLPNSVTSIGGEAFSGCNNLVIDDIPSSVLSIGSDAFYDVKEIKHATIHYNENMNDYSVFNANKYSIILEQDISSSFHYDISDNKLESLTISNGVSRIENSAFEGITSLSRIDIPSTVTSIEWNAFYGCNLAELYINSQEVVSDMYNNNYTYGGEALQSISIKEEQYDSTKESIRDYNRGGAFVFNEIVNGYAKYVYDPSQGQNDSNSSDSCS